MHPSISRVRGARRQGALVAITMACLAASPAWGRDFRQELTASFNESAQLLFEKLRDKPGNGNIVISPYSIGTAMAMVFAGARGETEREMASVLRLKQSRADVADASGSVITILNGYDRREVRPTCPERTGLSDGLCAGAPSSAGQCPARTIRDGARCVATPVWPETAQLRTANALMLGRDKGSLIAPAYIALLKDRYAAQFLAKATVADVNDWVSGRTEGRIPKLLDRLDPSAPAVIVNAVYFKAAWRVPFSRGATAPSEFNLTATWKVQVPTMRLRSGFALRQGPGYRALRLPYTVAELSMVVVLPDEIDGLPRVMQRLTANELAGLFAALQAESERPVVVALPRFKAAFRTGLGETFRQLGMQRAFDLKQADFSGMTSRSPAEAPLAIHDVIHQAMIDVTEAGTEAAAATAIAMATASFQPKLEQFSVDRPFLFFITDDVTGAILFQGRIVDPR